MTDGFLGGLNLGGVAAATSGIEPGTYACLITKSELVTPDGKPTAWVITYRVPEGAPNAGKSHAEWWNNLAGMTDNAKGYLKRRLLQLGIPEEVHGTMKPEDIIGTPVWLTLYKNSSGYMAVGSVKLRAKSNLIDPKADPDFNERTNSYGAASAGTATPQQFISPTSPSVASTPASLTDGL